MTLLRLLNEARVVSTAEPLAAALGVTSWALDRAADGLGWLSDSTGTWSETARWWAVATRAAP